MNIALLIFSVVTGKVSSAFLKTLLPLFSKQAQIFVSKVLPQALKIVSDLAAKNELTNKQKQKTAFDELTKVVKTEGLEAGTSLVNLVIELAVAQTKNK